MLNSKDHHHGVCQLKLTLIIQIDAYYIHRFIQIHIPNIVNPHGNNDHLMHVVKKDAELLLVERKHH